MSATIPTGPPEAINLYRCHEQRRLAPGPSSITMTAYQRKGSKAGGQRTR
jgi:hypothetical protein